MPRNGLKESTSLSSATVNVVSPSAAWAPVGTSAPGTTDTAIATSPIATRAAIRWAP